MRKEVLFTMQIHGDEYSTLVVVDRENNLLCCFNDKDAITSGGVKILTEQQLGGLAFVPMENDTVKCFIRGERSVFPKGTMNTEQFYEHSANDSNDKEELEETTKQKQNEEEQQINPQESVNMSGLTQLIKNMPKEALTQFVNGMTKNITQEADKE